MKKGHWGFSKPQYANFVAIRYEVRVVFSTDVTKAIEHFSPGLPDLESTTAIALHTASCGESLVIFPYDVTPGVIAHEAWHVVHRMHKFKDMKLDNETVAYHLDYLVDRILECKQIAQKAKRTYYANLKAGKYPSTKTKGRRHRFLRSAGWAGWNV